MTTDRTYRCNLCNTPIGVTDNSTKGRGVYFVGSPGPWLEFRAVPSVEHHLCEQCIQGVIASASTSTRKA